MDSGLPFQLAADLVLALHVAFVAFVLLGLMGILLGGLFCWRWVRNAWFRWAHLAAIAIVVAQASLGRICPLTTWEMALRQRAGGATYSGSFIAHWLESLLYYEAPPWAFTLAYTAFGLLVAAAWIWVRPRAFHRRSTLA